MKSFKKIAAILLVMMTLSTFVFISAAAEFQPSPIQTPLPALTKAVPSISITASSVEVTVGKTISMTAETEDGATPKITWSSSDSSVAAVDENGTVKGKKAGKVTITASAEIGGKTVSDSMPIYVVTGNNVIKDLLKEKQVLGYKYSYRDDYYYTNDKKCWQSNFGFGPLYDIVAPYVLLEYDYVRIFFTYEDKDWMIQFWKGQYGLLFFGSEQGVYTKPHSDKKDGLFTFYQCADEKDWLDMEMTLFHDEKGNGNYVRQFSRDYGKYWWCTGFKPGHLRIEEPAKELRTVGTITLKDEEMTKLFVEGLKKCGFKQAKNTDSIGLDEFYADGNSVHFTWQNISHAETTMPIKIAGGMLIGANVIAAIVGLFAIIAMLLGAGIIFIL